MRSCSMAFERVFARVLNKLPENDATALAVQKDKVIELLRKELLAEGLLVAREGGGAPTASTQRHGAVVGVSSQNDLSVSAEKEALTELLYNNVDEATALEDLASEEDHSGNEEIPAPDNREAECEAVQIPSTTTKKFSFVPYSECLVIASIGKACGRATSKLPGPHSNGMEKEISEIPELLNRCKVKHTVSLAPFWVEGQGRLNDVWVDDEMVSHSKEFYLALLQDFFQECRTPGGVLYFTGLSQEGTGNWCFRDGVISLEELLDLYQRFFKHRMLYIIADCSFSGQWVIQALECFDRLGIPPCGHHSLDQGMLLKVWATCRKSEQAKMLHGVREVMRIDDERFLTFQSRENRHMTFSSIYICCESKMLNSCDDVLISKMPSLKWSDRLKSHLVYLVRGKDKGRAAWHYVMVDEGNINNFREQVASGNVDVAKYGRVLYSGWGVDPPDETKSQINSFFP